ncbi:hypothetical protein FGB62_5g018 [Gracilaria domingensis]|nr:hypothetical protein FGB62_5g018 [Gracilaria domingensis]
MASSCRFNAGLATKNSDDSSECNAVQLVADHSVSPYASGSEADYPAEGRSAPFSCSSSELDFDKVLFHAVQTVHERVTLSELRLAAGTRTNAPVSSFPLTLGDVLLARNENTDPAADHGS